MPKKIDPSTDVWHGVHDARKRKQIQDRLAQRARRQRLAKSTGEPVETGISKKKLGLPSPSSDKNSVSITPPPDTVSPNPEQLILPNITMLCNALFRNGILLNIPCGTSTVGKSRPAPPHVPDSLQPTELQRTVVHFGFIDRFPLPTMRENMILMADCFNTEEFLWWIFSMDTFRIDTKKETWDESAWVPTREFRSKWGFLFDSGKNGNALISSP